MCSSAKADAALIINPHCQFSGLPFKPLYPAAEIASFDLRGATENTPKALSMSRIYDFDDGIRNLVL